MGAKLERSRRVLRTSMLTEKGVTFFQEDEDMQDQEPRTEITFDAESWEFMGNPEVITVSIEPGDKLNG